MYRPDGADCGGTGFQPVVSVLRHISHDLSCLTYCAAGESTRISVNSAGMVRLGALLVVHVTAQRCWCSSM